MTNPHSRLLFIQDLHLGTRLGVLWWEIRVRNAGPDAVAVFRAVKVADGLVTVEYGPVGQHRRVRIIKGQTGDLVLDVLAVGRRGDGFFPDEVSVEIDGPAETGLVWVVFGVEVFPPQPKSLLDAQGVERAVAVGSDVVLFAPISRVKSQLPWWASNRSTSACARSIRSSSNRGTPFSIHSARAFPAPPACVTQIPAAVQSPSYP